MGLIKFQIALYSTGFLAVAGAGYFVYNASLGSLNKAGEALNTTLQKGTEFVSSVAPVKDPTVEINVTDVKNQMNLKAKIESATFKSTSLVKITQTGARDTWVIGGLLEGSATFSYTTEFNGNVVYDLDKVIIQPGPVEPTTPLTLTLPAPTVNTSRVNIKRLDINGDLADLSIHEYNTNGDLETNDAQNWFYKQFYNEKSMTNLFEGANKTATDGLQTLIQTLMDKTHGPGKVKVNVLPATTAPTTFNQGDIPITFEQVLSTDPLTLQNLFKKRNPKITVNSTVKNSH